MSYLLDTNIISELVKKKPNHAVLDWVDANDSENLYLSVITLGEIRKGISGVQNQARQKEISHWLEVELPAYFEARILAIDMNVADAWGKFQSQTKGRTLPAIDALIAATAYVNQLTLVTRNTKDFVDTPIEIVNPWNA